MIKVLFICHGVKRRIKGGENGDLKEGFMPTRRCSQISKSTLTAV